MFAAAATSLAVAADQGLASALLPLAALLVALAGLAGTTSLALARARVAALETAESAIGRAARRPQATLVPLLALTAGGVAWLAARPAAPLPAPLAPWALAAAALAGFALLLAERHVAAAPMDEAAALSRLLRVPVVVIPAQGLLLAAASAGLPWTRAVTILLAVAVGAVALELAARGVARGFLPPPAAGSARAAVDSVLLRAAGRPTPGALAEPLRDHFGIDFSRSWALAYARAALAPLGLVLLLAAWGLTGLVLVPVDGRAVAERFGAPVAVLRPGAHLVLPWPLGRAVPVEFGAVHETTLGGDAPAPRATPAEALAPPDADRLWEGAHPGELTVLVASQSGGRPGFQRQEFQVVSADIRVLYRVGLTDADALRSIVATTDPGALVRAAAGRAVAATLAGRTLEDALGASRDTLSDRLLAATQRTLDGFASGVRVVAVVIEAIHPPAGAAAAYHRVQAAEIEANTTIATERGRARAARALAEQRSRTRLDEARATAAEQRGEAAIADIRFAADRAADQAGGPAFLLERAQDSLVAALAGTPKTILDRRLGAGGPTVVDLRPFLPAAPAARDD